MEIVEENAAISNRGSKSEEGRAEADSHRFDVDGRRRRRCPESDRIEPSRRRKKRGGLEIGTRSNVRISSAARLSTETVSQIKVHVLTDSTLSRSEYSIR